MTAGQSSFALIADSLARELRLQRPLAFIDLETTGTDPQTARIVEISVARVAPDGGMELVTRRVNPEVPIPLEATAIHGITDSDVDKEPTFRRISRSLIRHLDGCDLAGFGIARFDVKVLAAEFRRSGQWLSIDDRAVVDALAIYFEREPRDLAAALRFYRGRELEGAHSAQADVLASLEVLLGQIEQYKDLPRDLSELDRISAPRRVEPNWIDEHGLLILIDNEVCLNFGKYRGTRLVDVMEMTPDYLDWILKGDFPPDVKAAVIDARRGQERT